MATELIQPEEAQAPPPEVRESGEKLYFGRFTEHDLADQINRKWREADERLRDYFNIALETWDSYRNKQDFSDKEDWQSRVTLAKAHSAVKQGVANIRKLFAQARDVVLVEDPSGKNAAFAPYIQEAIKQVWDRAGFLDETSEALESGLIMGLIAVRQDWQFRETTQFVPQVVNGQISLVPQASREGFLNLKAIDPWNLRWGPETGPRTIDWIIEERIIKVSTLLGLGFQLPEEIINSDFRQDEMQAENRRRKDEIQETRGQVERRSRVWEYHGPLIDEKTQEVIVKDAHVILGNKTHVLQAEENRYWRKKPPYVLASPLRVAFRFPGQGILEVNRALKANIDAIAQLGTDYLKFSALPMFEIDMSAMENPEDLATGSEPGKMFRKRPGAGALRAIQQVDIRPLTNDVFNMMLGLDKEYQRSTFITEVVQGLLDTKGETTATEVQSTIAASTVMLASIARDLEDQYIESSADMTWDYLLQFMDITSNPNWEKILGPAGRQLDILSRPERVMLIQGGYEFKARGISLQVERQIELQKMIQYLQVISTMVPAAIPLLNMPVIFQRIHEAFSFPKPNELLAPNAFQVFPIIQRDLIQSQSPSEQFAGEAGKKLVEGLITQAVQTRNKPNGKERQ